MKKRLLILLTFCISVIGYAQTFNALDNNGNTLEFNITSATTVEVKDYISGGTDVDIPATVMHSNTTYNVTGIGVLAFLSNGLTSALIPNGVTSIGVGAFQNNMLASITIPDGITSIANNAFYINQLTSITIPNSTASIGNYAFKDNAIMSLTLGDNVSSIGDFAFHNNLLTSIILPNSMTMLGDVSFQANPLNCIVSEATTPPTMNTTNNGLDSFTLSQRGNIDLSIPSGTSSAYAASSWTSFNSVSEGLAGTFVIDHITYQINGTPANEVTVSNYNTAGGTVVNIPATVSSACTLYSVTTIGDYAFQNTGVTSVTLPNTIVNINENAFFNNALSTITIPDSVLTIHDGAFANNNLTTVVIGNNVTSIGEYAFRFNSLASITIPDSVININALAFNSNALTNIQLGSGLQTIGNEAFKFNNALQSVTIPANVSFIGDAAFAVPSLTDVYSEGTTPPTITTNGTVSDTFAVDRSTIHLHIPAGTLGVYVTDVGALWTSFNPVTEDALSVSDFEFAHTIKVISISEGIKITSSNTIQLQNYTMYSISGAEVIKGTQSDISTSFLADGIYVLKLDFDKGTAVRKVIIN